MSYPFAHPLDPLSAFEISAAVSAVRAHIQKGIYATKKPIEKTVFNSVTLREPSKHAVLKWSGVLTDDDLEKVRGEKDDLKRQADVSCLSLGR